MPVKGGMGAIQEDSFANDHVSPPQHPGTQRLSSVQEYGCREEVDFEVVAFEPAAGAWQQHGHPPVQVPAAQWHPPPLQESPSSESPRTGASGRGATPRPIDAGKIVAIKIQAVNLWNIPGT
jgi:hypothetical protein